MFNLSSLFHLDIYVVYLYIPVIPIHISHKGRTSSLYCNRTVRYQFPCSHQILSVLTLDYVSEASSSAFFPLKNSKLQPMLRFCIYKQLNHTFTYIRSSLLKENISLMEECVITLLVFQVHYQSNQLLCIWTIIGTWFDLSLTYFLFFFFIKCKIFP